MWTGFPVNYISYVYILGRMAQDLNLVVSPYIYVLDIDDFNTDSLPAEEIEKIANFLRGKNWSTHSGIIPTELNYLESGIIEKNKNDTEKAGKLELEKKQVAVMLKNSDVFIPVLHAHGGTRWTASTEKEQSGVYLDLLKKLRRYGFQLNKDSFGYMYFPSNEFNNITVDYLPKIGVHIARVCIETFPKYENHYYQCGPLSLVPSDCPINAIRKSITCTNENPIEFFATTRWYFLDAIFNKKVIFIHGDNFSDGELGLTALSNISSLIDGSKIVIYGSPFDLRDKYTCPFRILSQTEEKDKTILTFDRELTGQKLISTGYPLQRVVNDKNEDIILFDSNIFCGVGQTIELYRGLTGVTSIPKLKKVSSNAFLRYAIYKNDRITIELEGYGMAEIILANLKKSVPYLITNRIVDSSQKPLSISQISSTEGEINFSVPISSYNTLLLEPAK